MGGSDSCRRHYSDDGRLRRPTVPDGSASLAEQIERSLLRPMYTAVRARASDSPGLYRKIENYVTRYLLACGRSASDALAAYERFLRRYMEDVSHFVATGCYPTQAPDGPIGRWEYDAALLLSVLVTEHRYRIMQLVAAHSDTAGRTAVVGVGAGLEVELLKPSGCELHGWDLSLSDAVARLLIRIIRRLGADVGARRTAPPGSTAPRQLTYGPLYALSALRFEGLESPRGDCSLNATANRGRSSQR